MIEDVESWNDSVCVSGDSLEDACGSRVVSGIRVTVETASCKGALCLVSHCYTV